MAIKNTQFKKGQVPHNKGKTKESYEPQKRSSKAREREDINKRKDDIINLYINKKKSQCEISKIIGCDFVVINRILKENKIEIRPQSYYLKRQVSHNKGKTYEELYGKKRAKEMIEDMKRRSLGKTWEELYGKAKTKEMRKQLQRGEINKQEDYIIDLYVDKNKTQSEIAKTLRCSITIINRILKENKIKINPQSFYTTGRESPRKGKTFKEYYGKEKAREISEKMSKTLREDKVSRKGKTYEEYYGKDRAKLLSEKMSKAHKGMESLKKGKTHEELYGKEKAGEISEKISKGLNGRKSPMKGKTYEEYYGKDIAKELKKNLIKLRSKRVTPTKDTTIELKIQDFLTKLRLEFVTHKYMNIKNAYQCDILIPKQIKILEDSSMIEIKQKTIIECDGDYFHGNPTKYNAEDIVCFNMKAKDRWKIDNNRTQELETDGFRVIRLWESEIRQMELSDLRMAVTV